jgi:ribosomal protein S18 acetylase RimI-like enzyme
MASAPTSATRTMSENLSLRPETAADEPFLYELYATTRDYEMIHVPWDDLQKQAFLRQQCEAQLKHYRQHYYDAEFQIIELDGRPIGRIYVHRSPKYICLMDIALLREYRGRGIGGGLTSELLRQAQADGKIVSLHVEHMNPARHLYERLGFQLVEDKGIYWKMEWSPPA